MLGSAKTPQTKKNVKNERRLSTVKVKEFRTDDICEITEITDRESSRMATNYRYESIMGGETRSPNIGKMRNKGTKTVNFFTSEFINIDLNR